MTSETTHRAAIVGAGPAGFYATEDLLKNGWEVDLYDALPTPFGLVRFGVAPDHPKIKNVIKRYEKAASHENFRFFGAVTLGEDITREDLLERYHAVIYATGTSSDNKLGIDGEDRPGSHPATEFVAWYNGHPDFADHEFDLSVDRAVVIGNGNVAIDVARMLVLDPSEVEPTDTADHAIEAFAKASVREVILLGRRGPAQAAFTNPELRELGELTRCDVIVDPADLELDEHSEASLADDATARRNVEMLRDYAAREPEGKTHRIVLKFLRSPVSIEGDGDDGNVEHLTVVRNELKEDGGRLRAVATDDTEVIDCGLVLRSIGYRGEPLCTVPFDERKGLIRNDGGRVTGDDGAPLTGEYVVGWIKRGPSGVIGTNKKDASDTIVKLLADAEEGKLNDPTGDSSADAIAAWIEETVPDHVTWEHWKAIDKAEVEAGAPHGRPRVKFVRRDAMKDIVAALRG